MSRFDDQLADDSEMSCFHCRFNNSSRQEDKINNDQLLCVGRLINILVYLLLRHLNWIKSYSTMKIGRIFFV